MVQIPLDLRWQADPECPQIDQALAEVEVLLGRPATVPADRPLAVDAQLKRISPSRWEVVLKTKTAAGDGERRVAGASCREITDASVLVIALAIDPAALSRTETPMPAPVPAPVADSPRDPVRVFGRPMALVEAGWLPSAAPRFGGALGVEWRRLRLELVGSSGLPRVMAIDRPLGAGARVFGSEVGLAGCYEVLARTVAISPCVGVGAGLVTAQSFGVSNPGTGTSAVFAAHAGLAVAVRVTRWLAVRLELQAGVSAPNTDFEIRGLPTVLRPGQAWFLGTLGPELSFNARN